MRYPRALASRRREVEEDQQQGGRAARYHHCGSVVMKITLSRAKVEWLSNRSTNRSCGRPSEVQRRSAYERPTPELGGLTWSDYRV